MAVGETILGAVLQVVFDRLASKQVLKLFESSKLDQSLVDKLKRLMLVAEKLLADAEQKQITDAAVASWLTELKHLFYRAEEIADQIATEAKRSSMDLSPEPKSFAAKVKHFIPPLSSSSSFASVVSLELHEIVTQLQDMVSLSCNLNLREDSVDLASTYRRVPTTSLLEETGVFGRDAEKEEILNLLFSEEAERTRISVVVIVGLGGMGKTTLAKHVFNDNSLKSFDLKAWVYVSEQFDVSRVTKSILERITGEQYSDSRELEFLQHELSKKLGERRIFLVLDDVWNENYGQWKILLAPLTAGAQGSKIIVTTRKDTVASIMQTVSVIRLQPLSNVDGWSLFSKHAFELGNLCTNPRIVSLGRKIVAKCQGLPLAIKTIGGLLRSQEDVHEWEALLQNRLWDLPGDVAPALMLSYYHLPSHLKRCFSYCAIFHKGYRFDRKKLVLMWMAEDFVKPSGGQRIEVIGEDYLNKLLSCSFFDRFESRVVMCYSLVHLLTLYNSK